MTSVKPKYSVIVPVYNSEKSISELVDRIEKSMTNYAPYELLMIDDLSTDNSWNKMKEAKANKQHIRLLRFTRNFGQAAASICGIREAKADTTIFIDDDLQFNPEDIPKLIAHYNPEKHYSVFGVPNKKKGGLGGYSSAMVDRIIQKMAFRNQDSTLRFSSFRISARKSYHGDSYSEKGMRSVHVFFTMVSPKLVDFIEVEHNDRKKGKSNYTLGKKIRLLLEIVVTLTELPIVWFINLVLFFFLITGLLTISIISDIGSWNKDWNALLIAFLGLNISLGIVFMFTYLRRVFLTFQGADVYAIWQEA